MSIRLEPATRHYDETLQKILKCSAKIFAEKGFHHTSVRDISRATKMSLSGLYYYFTTKEELLYLIQERCFLTLLQRWEQAMAADVDVRARIRAFAENHLSFFLHNMPEMKVMAQEQEGAKGIDLRLATFTLFGMMNWIYTWYQPKRDLALPQLVEQMLRIYFFGLLNSPGAQEEWFTARAGSSEKNRFSLWQNIP